MSYLDAKPFRLEENKTKFFGITIAVIEDIEHRGSKSSCRNNYSTKFDKILLEVQEEKFNELNNCSSPFRSIDRKLKSGDICNVMTNNYPDNVKWLDETAYFSPETFSGKPCRRMRAHEVYKREKKNKNSKICLNFSNYIKMTKTVYVYTGLLLFADIGGYFGILLGTSIYQIFESITNIALNNNKKCRCTLK